jgi:AraC-like DNA-binding protein
MAMYSTSAVPQRQRAEYWFGTVFSRLDPTGRVEEHRALQANLLRLSGDKGTQLLCLSGNAMRAERSLQRCARDGVDDISIDFLVEGRGATHAPAGAQALRPGGLTVLDCAQPVAIERANFRIVSLFLPRGQVEAVAGDPARLAGPLLAAPGLGTVLRHHVLATLGQAGNMRPGERTLAIGAARDMALAVLHLQAERQREARGDLPEHIDSGTYRAALAVMARCCTNPGLSPLHIAAAVGCSRATLYRAFGKQGETVAGAILRLRLAHAARLLCAQSEARLLISDVSYQSGFADHASFTRMFKRQYGMTPGEMRRDCARPGP